MFFLSIITPENGAIIPTNKTGIATIKLQTKSESVPVFNTDLYNKGNKTVGISKWYAEFAKSYEIQDHCDLLYFMIISFLVLRLILMQNDKLMLIKTKIYKTYNQNQNLIHRLLGNWLGKQ